MAALRFASTWTGARLLDRIQVFALEIFDESHLERHFFGHVPHNNRNALYRSALGRAPAAFACD